MDLILGKTIEGAGLHINLDRLVESRLLVQANSGGGKSWALRRILEQTHGKVQQIVIDVEDEFHTLREKYDYVLAGSTGGDCPADVRTAPLLARRLLELGVSAIVGIFELKAHDRVRFVRQFLDAMVNAPRDLWHPVLVVVDEAHVFCPQHGEAESASAVIDLMTRGRKRGFCGILATQRISKLHKDAAAEANNKLIGRSALDVDMKRAADELGFSSRDQQLTLRTLKPGQFYAFGPALSDTITEVKVGEIATTHPRAGNRVAPPAPPRAAILSALSKLDDLPKQAQEELNTVQALQARIRELERAERKPVPVIDQDAIGRAEIRGYDKGANDATAHWLSAKREVQEKAKGIQREIGNLFEGTVIPKLTLKTDPKIPRSEVKIHQNGHLVARATSVSTSSNTDQAMRKTGQLRMLTVLARFPEGRTRKQLALLAGLSPNSGSFSTYLSKLRTNGFMEGDAERLTITPAGMSEIGSIEPMPQGYELFEHWCREVGPGMQRMLRALYRGPLSREVLASEAGMSANSGSFSTYLSRLRTLELISGKKEISLSPELVG